MRTKTATDRVMGLAVEYDREAQELIARPLYSKTPTREISKAIKTKRLGPKQADKLSRVQVKWLIAVQEILTAKPESNQGKDNAGTII